MAYKISGNTSSAGKIIVIDETTNTVTGNELVSSGDYEVLDVGEGTKTVLARKSDGKTECYGNVSPIFYGLLHTIANPNAYGTPTNDQFGYSVAVSGNKCIVGAVCEDDVSGDSSGKAYIFDVTYGTLLHTLDPLGIGHFGMSVAISGDNCIVGAHYEDDAGDGSNSGKAYIFDVTNGNRLHTLNNPNAYSNPSHDHFGVSVAISGNNCIVGAYGEDEAGEYGSESGKAYIFDVTTGNLLHTLDNPNAYGTPSSDHFGWGVAINGNNCIVGAYREQASDGKAYIFDVTYGTLLHTLDNPNAYAGGGGTDRFGWGVAINGNNCIVGARNENDADGINSGKAYIFDVTTGNLLQTLDNPNAYSDSAGDGFGRSVSISGNKCIVGADDEGDSSGDDSGKAYIFDVTTGNLLQTLDNPNPYGTSIDDNFGWSVAINGNNCIVGAHYEDEGGTDSGKAYIFVV